MLVLMSCNLKWLISDTQVIFGTPGKIKVS